MFKVGYQPIPMLQQGDSKWGEVWAWTVSEGMVIVARFGNRDDAEEYADFKIAKSRGLPPEVEENKRLAAALAQAIVEKQAAEGALQAFMDGRFVLKTG